MEKLFGYDNSFDFISIKRLANCYLENGNERIELAGFQRGAAWKAWNVEELWDSILRWFPIGSLLLARATEFTDIGIKEPQLSKSGTPHNLNNSRVSNEVYLLIDGQQRSNAIALGFITYNHPKYFESGARLWLDIDDANNPNGKKFDFHLCTLDDPFGEKITFSQYRKALDSINQQGKDDSELSLFETYPIKAKIPVPFAEFIQIVTNFSNWDEIREKLLSESALNISSLCHKAISKKLIDNPSWRIRDGIFESIRSIILNENYKIPIILFQNRENQIHSKELGKLFERINVNGVTPPQAELFFSALKLMHPRIGDFVSEVNNNKEVKDILKPTEIILAGIRILKPEITEIKIDNFEKLTSDIGDRLFSLLENGNNDSSIFSNLMKVTYQALHYQGNGDYGLPRQLIMRLRPRVWHTVMLWLHINRENVSDSLQENDRFNIVRFAILDAMDYFIFTKWWRGYSRYVNDSSFDRLLTNEVINQPSFPIQNIFNQVSKRVQKDQVLLDSVLHIFSPEEYYRWIEPSKFSEITWNSHSAGGIVLMYAQRKYLHKWESLNDIDKDHIIPNSWMDFTGPTPTSKFWKVDGITANAGRSPIINSPGNFRYWPSSLNRQYQDRKPSEKYIKEDYESPLDHNHKIRGLNTVSDVLEASIINYQIVEMIDQLEKQKACQDPRIWTNQQYELLTHLIYKRCFLMYEDLYNSLNLYNMES